MSGASDVARLHRKLDGLARQFDGRELEARLLKMGREASEFVEAAVRATPAANGSLADGVMSGGKKPRGRWATFHLKGDARPAEGPHPTVAIRPSSKSVGPMRILEDGRKGARAGSLAYKGKAKATKNRGEASRLKVVKRTVGATEGKQTWSRAVDVMARYAAPAGRRVFVESWKKVLR